MTIKANVALRSNEFVAELSDGQRLVKASLRDMAQVLVEMGVGANETICEHRNGLRILTAGQCVALKAERRRIGKSAVRAPIALVA